MKTSEKSHPEYPLTHLYCYLSEGCNPKCRHCWIAPVHRQPGSEAESLDFDLFRSIVDQAKPLGLTGVKLTGGEPLLHPRIADILEVIRVEQLELVVETNGVLCTPELATAMARCKDASVAVSLDGADAATHEWVRGVEGSFEAALEGIRNLVAAGLRPQIIMCLMQRNRDQTEAVVRLAEQLDAESVKFNPVQPTARGEQVHRQLQALAIDELVELGRWVEDELSATASVHLYYGHPPAFRPLGKMFGQRGDGCGICTIFGILGVLADGSYALCGIGQTVPDLVFGHAARDPLRKVWEQSPVLKELRRGLPARLTGVCGECLMKSLCLGSCIAQNYYTARDLWAPFWFCEEAQAAGLFPPTRLRPAPD